MKRSLSALLLAFVTAVNSRRHLFCGDPDRYRPIQCKT